MHMNIVLLFALNPLTQCLQHVELGAFLMKFTYIEMLCFTLQNHGKRKLESWFESISAIILISNGLLRQSN